MKKTKIIGKMLSLMLQDLVEILNRVVDIFLKYIPIVLVTITSMFFLVGLMGLLVIEFKGLEPDPSKVRIFFFNVIEGYVLSLVTWLIHIRVWNKIINFFLGYYNKAKLHNTTPKEENNQDQISLQYKRPKPKEP